MATSGLGVEAEPQRRARGEEAAKPPFGAGRRRGLSRAGAEAAGAPRLHSTCPRLLAGRGGGGGAGGPCFWGGGEAGAAPGALPACCSAGTVASLPGRSRPSTPSLGSVCGDDGLSAAGEALPCPGRAADLRRGPPDCPACCARHRSVAAGAGAGGAPPDFALRGQTCPGHWVDQAVPLPGPRWGTTPYIHIWGGGVAGGGLSPAPFPPFFPWVEAEEPGQRAPWLQSMEGSGGSSEGASSSALSLASPKLQVASPPGPRSGRSRYLGSGAGWACGRVRQSLRRFPCPKVVPPPLPEARRVSKRGLAPALLFGRSSAGVGGFFEGDLE